MTTVIRLTGHFGLHAWKWRMEVDDRRMSLFVPALREPLVVALADIAGVYNPTTENAVTVEQSISFAPRDVVVPNLHPVDPAEPFMPVTLGVVFRTPQRWPPKSVQWRLNHDWFSREAGATHLDGFEVAVVDSVQARDAFAAVGVFETTNLGALFIETFGAVRRSSAEQARLGRRRRRERIQSFAVGGVFWLVSWLSIALFLWWRGWFF